MNINLQSPCNPMGYGQVGLHTALSLHSLGNSVAWWHLGNTAYEDQYRFVIDKMLRNQDFFDPVAPSVKIWHQFDMASHVGCGLRCGLPIFELDTFAPRELHHLNTLDKIFVCSHWAARIINNALPHKIRQTYVVPLGVNREAFNESIGAPMPGWTTFLNIGKWEIRKGHDILIQAFNKAFEPRNKVRLWMMNDNPFLTNEQIGLWKSSYKDTRMGDHISFLSRVNTSAEVAQVMGDVDCGVFPSRAEGWNLEVLEMMSMGKTVITTDYSAHTEYCTPENSLLIKIDELEVAEDKLWFNREGNWAKFGEAQTEQLINNMRWVYNHHGSLGLNQAGIETAKKFTWEATAKRLVQCLEMSSTDY